MSGTGWFCPGCNKYHAPHVVTCPGGANTVPGVAPSLPPPVPHFPYSPHDPRFPYQPYTMFPYTLSNGGTQCQKCGRYVTENSTCSIEDCGRTIKIMLNESQTGDDK